MTHLLANAGTPLLWFGMAYPILGSVTVAAIEVWLLKRFGVFDNGERKWNPILVGNLLSTVAGMLLLFLAGPLFGWLFGPKPLERVVPYSTAVWATAFVVTLVLEAPFYWLVARRKKLAALLGANVVTYAGLFVVTWFLSGTSLFRSVTVVDITAIKGSAEGWIYYVDGSAVRRIRLDGTRDEAATFHVDGKKSISIDTEDGVSANLVEYEPPKVLATNIGKAGQAALLPSQVLDSEVILDRVFRESFSYQPGRTFV